MKNKVFQAWLSSGRSVKSFSYQRPLTVKGNKIVLLNKKHGILTYLRIEV